MSNKTFQTVPTDLVEHAEAMREYFNTLGYKIKTEPRELGYPNTPAIVCQRTHTTVVIEVCSKINMATLREWVAYCKSSFTDTRIALCVPSESAHKYLAKHQAECQQKGIGVYVCENTQVNEWLAPHDISLNLELPDISNLPKGIRKALGSAYEQFERGQWRESFEEACKALESKAKPYLIKAINVGRLKIYESGVVKNPTVKQINKMTLGQLANAYSKAQPQNATDSVLHQTLAAINPARVGVAHKVNAAKTERQLRKNVGTHMHAIVQALKHLQ